MRCAECETIDDIIFDQTNVWLYLPTKDALKRTINLFERQKWSYRATDNNNISVSLPGTQMNKFAVVLFGELTRKELQETKILTTPAGSTKNNDLGSIDMGRVMNAEVFVYRIKGQWIVDALEKERYESWYQPIVHAAGTDQNQPFALEGLLRLRDEKNKIIPPSYVFQIADQADLLFSLDLAARASAVKSATKAGYRGNIFVNFNPSSIYDPANCLRTTAAAINELGLKPSDVTFELVETHRVDSDHLKGILAFYRQAGFKIALDDIGSGWSGLNMLHEVRPDYVKIDLDLVRDINENSLKQTIVSHLIAIAREHNIKVIAEGIETEKEAQILRQMNVDYLQGYLFCKPDTADNVLSKYSPSQLYA